MSTRRAHLHTLSLLAVCLVALTARLAYLADLWRSPLFLLNLLPGLDMATYYQWALHVSQGDLTGGTTEPFFQAPLYPTLLGGAMRLVGPSVAVLTAIQAVLGVGDCLLLYALGRRLGGARVGILASLLYALYPLAWYYDGLLLSEPLLTFLLLLVATLGQRALDDTRLRMWLLLGATCGLAALAKANALALLPVFGMAAAWQRGLSRSLIGSVALGGLAAVAVVSPPVLYTLAHFGVFQPVSGQGAYLWASGNSITSTGLYQESCGPLLSPASVNFWLLQARKLVLFWSNTEFGNNSSLPIFQAYLPSLRWWPLGFGPLAALGLFGAGILLPHWRRWLAVYLVLGIYVLSIVAFVIIGRYRLPAAALLCLPAAAGLVALPHTLRHAPMRVAITAVLVGALMLAANVGVPADPSPFFDHLNAAEVFRQRGYPELASAERQQARAVRDDLRGTAFYRCYPQVFDTLPD